MKKRVFDFLKCSNRWKHLAGGYFSAALLSLV